MGTQLGTLMFIVLDSLISHAIEMFYLKSE